MRELWCVECRVPLYMYFFVWLLILVIKVLLAMQLLVLALEVLVAVVVVEGVAGGDGVVVEHCGGGRSTAAARRLTQL